MELHGLDLRRYLLARLIERGGDATVADLVADLRVDGFRLPGRASKSVSDALRPDIRRRRVVRLERGTYAIDRLPRTTRHRIVHHARRLREARDRTSRHVESAPCALSLAHGTHRPAPDRPFHE